MRDPLFLAGKSEPATEADKQVVQDLLDTLKANQDRCVGIRTIVPGTINQLMENASRGCGSFLGPELSNSKTASILHWTQTAQ